MSDPGPITEPIDPDEPPVSPPDEEPEFGDGGEDTGED